MNTGNWQGRYMVGKFLYDCIKPEQRRELLGEKKLAFILLLKLRTGLLDVNYMLELVKLTPSAVSYLISSNIVTSPTKIHALAPSNVLIMGILLRWMHCLFSYFWNG